MINDTHILCMHTGRALDAAFLRGNTAAHDTIQWATDDHFTAWIGMVESET